MIKKVYNKKTGKSVIVEAVDGREYLDTGEWQADPIVDVKPKSKIETTKKTKPIKKAER